MLNGRDIYINLLKPYAMDNIDKSFDDVRIEIGGGDSRADVSEGQQPEVPAGGAVDDNWYLDPALDSIPVEIHVLDDIGYSSGTLSFL